MLVVLRKPALQALAKAVEKCGASERLHTFIYITGHCLIPPKFK